MLDLVSVLEKFDSGIWHIINKHVYNTKIPKDHAQDMYQEVCIKLMTKLKDFDETKSSLQTYVWNITRNTCMRYTQIYFADASVELDEERVHVDDVHEYNTNDLIGRFPCSKRYKKVIYMTLEGYKQQEIAKELNLSQSTVSRVLSEFKDYLLENAE